MVGIGVAEGSGLFTLIIRFLVIKAPETAHHGVDRYGGHPVAPGL
jgi:p-aminobenzoyl-glutamate transporter AbgT